MKKIALVLASVIGIAGLSSVPAQAADVGVSVSIGQPGFYGRIDLGNSPRPQVIYSQPMWIERGPSRMEPIYLHVPTYHQQNWRRYCREYGACGQPVYFVRDNWYRDVYVPHYRDHYYGERWHEARRDRDHDGIPDYRDRDRGTMRDRDQDGIPDNRDRDHGRGNDRGHGHDKGRRD